GRFLGGRLQPVGGSEQVKAVGMDKLTVSKPGVVRAAATFACVACGVVLLVAPIEAQPPGRGGGQRFQVAQEAQVPKPPDRDAAALAEAARVGDFDTMKKLLAEPRDVNAPDLLGTPALHWLVERGELDGVKLLLGKGADPNRASDHDALPLYLAAVNGDAAMIRVLVEGGADP